MNAELEASEPWRKSKQFICKPYGASDPEAAKLFLKQFLDAAEGVEQPGGEWTAADTLNGDDEGGSNNPIGGGLAAAVRASKQRKYDVRCKKAMSLLKQHMLIETVADKLRDDYAGDPEGAIDWFRQNECGGATNEPQGERN